MRVRVRELSSLSPELIDANLLIYAIDADSPHHRAARKWLEEALTGTEAVGLAWIVILAFLRVVTHSRIMRRPLQPEAALGYLDA
jgi:predicted nucleic acid-binding protein